MNNLTWADFGTFEAWIENAIAGHEGAYGVRMKIETPAELTVTCNLYRTTKENALACRQAFQAVLGSDVSQWGVEVDVLLFKSHGTSNDN